MHLKDTHTVYKYAPIGHSRCISTLRISERYGRKSFQFFHIVMLSLPKHPAARRTRKKKYVIQSKAKNLVETNQKAIAPDKVVTSSQLYKGWAFETLNATFPFPQVFSLSPFPLASCKGTHGDRVAGDNTRSRHNLRHFPYYVTRSQAKETTLACSLVLNVKSDARFARRRCGSCSVFEVISTLRIGDVLFKFSARLAEQKSSK